MLSTARPCSASRQCRSCGRYSRLHHLFLYSYSDHWQAVCNDKILPHSALVQSQNTTALPSDGTGIYLWMKRIIADWTNALCVFLKQKEMLLSLVPPTYPTEEEEVLSDWFQNISAIGDANLLSTIKAYFGAGHPYDVMLDMLLTCSMCTLRTLLKEAGFLDSAILTLSQVLSFSERTWYFLFCHCVLPFAE